MAQNIYGTGNDLAYAKGKFGTNGYNYVDTGVNGYAGPQGGYTANDIVVGGAGTVGGVKDGGAATRLWGMNSQGTNSAIDYYAKNGKAMSSIYGSGVDLDNAKSRYGGGYNYVNLDGYAPGTFNGANGDLVLGGTTVTGAVNQGNAKRLAGADRYATQDAINTYGNKVDARRDAEDVYNPQYNATVTAIKNALAAKLAAMEQSKGGVNARYDNQIKDVNRNNEVNINNYSNNLASRGMGRSTFYTSGVAGLNDGNNRRINDVNFVRNGELSGIDANKVLEQGNTENTLLTLAGDKDTKINAMARENEKYLNDRDDRNKETAYSHLQDTIKREQFIQQYQDQLKQQAWQNAYNEKVFAADQANKAQALAASRSSGGGYRGGSSGGSSAKQAATQDLNDFTAALYRASQNGTGQDLLKANQDSIIQRFGLDAYQKLDKMVKAGYTYPTSTDNSSSADAFAALRNS